MATGVPSKPKQQPHSRTETTATTAYLHERKVVHRVWIGVATVHLKQPS